LDAGQFVFQPFATASVFHDFEGGQLATIQTNFAGLLGLPGFPEINGQLTTSRLGTYGQFGLGTVAQLKDTGWLAYIRGDYRTGAGIDGWSLNGGLRYQFSPQSVVVAGRSADPPVAPVPLAHNWTGLYIGGFLGVDWGYTNWQSPDFPNSVKPRFAGVIGGGGLGYNYQTGPLVLGVEGDFGWTNAIGGRACPNNFFFSCNVDINWLSTVTGRVGVASLDRLLLYIKGGLALGEVAATGRCNTGSETTIFGPVEGCPAQSTTKTSAGWTIGAGSEFALTDVWSAKAEINYFDLGKAAYGFEPLNNPVEIGRSGFISRIGVNYRFADLFGLAPVVAKY
jgi:opacity protein-like surface antigen